MEAECRPQHHRKVNPTDNYYNVLMISTLKPFINKWNRARPRKSAMLPSHRFATHTVAKIENVPRFFCMNIGNLVKVELLFCSIALLSHNTLK